MGRGWVGSGRIEPKREKKRKLTNMDHTVVGGQDGGGDGRINGDGLRRGWGTST